MIDIKTPILYDFLYTPLEFSYPSSWDLIKDTRATYCTHFTYPNILNVMYWMIKDEFHKEQWKNND